MSLYDDIMQKETSNKPIYKSMHISGVFGIKERIETEDGGYMIRCILTKCACSYYSCRECNVPLWSPEIRGIAIDNARRRVD